jgi:hypothetical protein
VITTPRRDKIPVRVVKEEEPFQHRLIRRIRRVPGVDLQGVPVVLAEKTTNIADLRGCGLDR